MSLVLRRFYVKLRKNVSVYSNSYCMSSSVFIISNRSFSDDNVSNYDYYNSTILIENGYIVHELPIVIRKLKGLSEYVPKVESMHRSSNSVSYHLIQSEFKKCLDLREVFSLITKCTKITPNIALGAIERIYELEKSTPVMVRGITTDHVNIAKDAILDKLLKVVMHTEDTYSILNILKTMSSLIEPHKHKFCDELLDRVIDNKLTLDQLCDFTEYLINNNIDPKYSETIDKLWVGFIEKESEIDENNIEFLFRVLPGLKSSKRTILILLEHKLAEIWNKITVSSMQNILEIFIKVKYFSLQSFAVMGCWFNRNIHTLDEDTILNIMTKFINLNYTDDQIEKAVEKYMKHKSTKIKSHVLVVTILNYCMQFQIRNECILNVCQCFIMKNLNIIPAGFLKCFIYPFGYLNYVPYSDFWNTIEKTLMERLERINADHLSSIALSFIYIGKHPCQLVKKIFAPEYLAKVNNQDVMKRLHLIDTVLSLESSEYPGPLLPKDRWLKPVSQDKRVESILEKIGDVFTSTVEHPIKITKAVLIPNICSDQTYLIDIMLHSSDYGRNLCNLRLKSSKDAIIAVLVHLPDHYCSDNETFTGPQVLKIRQLRILGMNVASLKYTQLSQLHILRDKSALRRYIKDSIDNAAPCI